MDQSGKPPLATSRSVRRPVGKAVAIGSRLATRLGRDVRSLVGAQRSGEEATPPIEPYTDFDTVFDATYYLRQVEEDIAPLTPKEHFCFIGWRRSLDPSPLFDVGWYVEQYPDVLVGRFDPLSDYLLAGWLVGRDPTPWFSTSWYLEQLAAHEIEPVNPLVHYVGAGVQLGLTVSLEHFELMARRQRDSDLYVEDDAKAMIEIGGTSLPIATLDSFGPGLVSVDMWDTLIERERPADAAKLATTRRLAHVLGRPTDAWRLFEERVDLESELAKTDDAEEYHAREVIESLVRRAVGEAQHVDATSVAEALYTAEVDDECMSTRRREPLASVISHRIDQGLPTAVLSDFYMGSEDLGRILTSNEINVPADDILSSVDIRASKRIGTAFATVRNRYEVVNS